MKGFIKLKRWGAKGDWYVAVDHIITISSEEHQKANGKIAQITVIRVSGHEELWEIDLQIENVLRMIKAAQDAK